jgi:hypothetical protein
VREIFGTTSRTPRERERGTENKRQTCRHRPAEYASKQDGKTSTEVASFRKIELGNEDI